jgi:transposase
MFVEKTSQERTVFIPQFFASGCQFIDLPLRMPFPMVAVEKNSQSVFRPAFQIPVYR